MKEQEGMLSALPPLAIWVTLWKEFGVLPRLL